METQIWGLFAYPGYVSELDGWQLEREIEELRRENARLKRLLKLTDREAAPAQGSQAAWFDRDPGPVDAQSSPAAKVAFYAALFGARTDVYAIRWENARYGKSGWVPAVEGGWRKGAKQAERHYLQLTSEVFTAHLTGTHQIGLYPMLSGNRTCWLAADFDGQVLSDALDEHDGDEPSEDGAGGLVSRGDHDDDTGRGRSRFVVMVSPE